MRVCETHHTIWPSSSGWRPRLCSGTCDFWTVFSSITDPTGSTETTSLRVSTDRQGHRIDGASCHLQNNLSLLQLYLKKTCVERWSTISYLDRYKVCILKIKHIVMTISFFHSEPLGHKIFSIQPWNYAKYVGRRDVLPVIILNPCSWIKQLCFADGSNVLLNSTLTSEKWVKIGRHSLQDLPWSSWNYIHPHWTRAWCRSWAG